MSDVDDEKNPWVDLASLLCKRVPVGALVTVIDTDGLKAIDRFGRLVDANNGDEKDNCSVKGALSHLAAYYKVLDDPMPSIDPDSLLDPLDSPLASYGWPEDEVPPIEGMSFVDHRIIFDAPYNQGHSETSGTSEVGRGQVHAKGVLAKQIVQHFDFWSAVRWTNLTGNPPLWLKGARLEPVVPCKAAYWNPADFAECLWAYRIEHWHSFDRVLQKHARSIPSRHVLQKIVQEHFPGWAEELQFDQD